MKKLIITVISSILIISTVICASAAIISPGLLVLSAEDPMVMSGMTGEPIAFTAKDFCRHLGIDSFDSITITSLPPENEGKLSIAGEAVSENGVISFTEAVRRVFSPAEGVTESSFSFSVSNSCEAKCSVVLTEKINLAPAASSSLTALQTFAGMSVSGHMVASDPEGDALIYEITAQPQNGTLTFDKNSGDFTYTSDTTGGDSFSFCVKDTYGNYSDTANVKLYVTRNTTGISFTDMKGNGAYAAAVSMVDEGIMTTEEVDGSVYFSPTGEISRLDFLVCAMDILGANNLPKVSSSGFADDESIPENKKSYVYSAYKLGIINGISTANGELYFDPERPITRAEASVILNNIIGYTATADYSFGDSVPAWASASFNAMYELGVLSPKGANANVFQALTRSECANILARLSELI